MAGAPGFVTIIISCVNILQNIALRRAGSCSVDQLKANRLPWTCADYPRGANGMDKMDKVDEKDRRLFRDSIGEVRRINQDYHSTYRPRSPPQPLSYRHTQQDGLQKLSRDLECYTDVLPGEPLFYARPGLSRSVIRRLRRGRYRIDAELDLHGFNLTQAYTTVTDFLREAHKRNRRCLRIVHGKGLRSAHHEPIIKPNLNSWLQKFHDVLAFCSAPQNDGGTGAVYVLLKNW